MRPADIEITTKDIRYAEKILLPKEKKFDIERRDFICNLDTIDLQAVPGSGKTMALLAKLLILERYLPLNNGAGILVISHTNTAVDEIENKIRKYCPKLFKYPNFVGTIQSFVDRFLAIPFYVNKYRKKLYRIDNEIYDEKSGQYFDKMSNNKAKNYLMRRNNPRELFQSLRFDSDLNLTKNINGKIFLRAKKNSDAYRQIRDAKFLLLKWGYLHFDDAYFLANYYIHKYPLIKKLIQKRFRLVFVDEMQDIDKHQYDILEKLFYRKDVLQHSYQRIGDKNQAIYNADIKLDGVWDEYGRKTLKLKGSHRLTPEIAKIVECFALDHQRIDGLRESRNIKPYIIVFEDPRKVLLKFTELIKEKKLDDKIHPFCGVCWTTHKTEEDKKSEKIRLQDYHLDFEKDEHKPKTDYKTLKDYLKYFDKTENSLAPVKKNILNVFIKILRIEDRKDENNRNYTKSKFLDYLKENNIDKYEELKLKLFEWSWSVIKGDDVFDEIKNYIPKFFKTTKNIFELDNLSIKSKEFINSSNALPRTGQVIKTSRYKNNIHESSGIKVKIGTVHSVKGETHAATLYMESFYERGDNYESKRLEPQISGKKVLKSKKFLKSTPFAQKLIQQSAKMVYVGFSRPTHLLCFAIHKNRWKTIESKDFSNWRVVAA